jgi:hypothetical protein
MPVYLIYPFNPFPDIEPPFLDDSIIWMLIVKSGKNVDSGRESSTAFFDGDNSIARRASFPSENGLHLFTECANLIAGFLKDVRIDGKV